MRTICLTPNKYLLNAFGSSLASDGENTVPAFKELTAYCSGFEWWVRMASTGSESVGLLFQNSLSPAEPPAISGDSARVGSIR